MSVKGSEPSEEVVECVHVDSDTLVPADVFEAFEIAGAEARDRGQHVLRSSVHGHKRDNILRISGGGIEQEQCLMISVC